MWIAKSIMLLEFSVNVGLDPCDFLVCELQSNTLSYAGGHHQALSTGKRKKKKNCIHKVTLLCLFGFLGLVLVFFLIKSLMTRNVALMQFFKINMSCKCLQ